MAKQSNKKYYTGYANVYRKPKIDLIFDHLVALPCCNNNIQVKLNASTVSNKLLRLMCMAYDNPKHSSQKWKLLYR